MIPRHSYQSLAEVFSGIFVIPVDCESGLEILHRLVQTSIVCIKSPTSYETFHVIIVNVQGLVEALERFHVITGFEILDTLSNMLVSPLAGLISPETGGVGLLSE